MAVTLFLASAPEHQGSPPVSWFVPPDFPPAGGQVRSGWHLGFALVSRLAQARADRKRMPGWVGQDPDMFLRLVADQRGHGGATSRKPFIPQHIAIGKKTYQFMKRLRELPN